MAVGIGHSKAPIFEIFNENMPPTIEVDGHSLSVTYQGYLPMGTAESFRKHIAAQGLLQERAAIAREGYYPLEIMISGMENSALLRREAGQQRYSILEIYDSKPEFLIRIGELAGAQDDSAVSFISPPALSSHPGTPIKFLR